MQEEGFYEVVCFIGSNNSRICICNIVLDDISVDCVLVLLIFFIHSIVWLISKEKYIWSKWSQGCSRITKMSKRKGFWSKSLLK